jgi:diguanylate cyclase (GGDEF)-like protein
VQIRILSLRTKAGLAVVLLVLVLLLGAVDYLTGSELAFSLFYLFPVGLAAWYVNWQTGVFTSLVAALLWYLADILARTEPYSQAHIPAWNAGTRLIIFFVVTTLLVALREALARESQHARVDYLTEAANVRAFYEAAETDISRLKRYGRSFSILYLDADNLKQVNDSRGHSVGDAALKATVSTLKRATRAGDTVARLGGDEFAVLLADADSRAADVVATRVQDALRQSLGRHYKLTFSIGVLTCPSVPPSVDDLVQRADNLMFEAKRSGKDAIRQSVYEGTA